MRDHFLPFSPPLIGEEEITEVVDTLHSGWITTGLMQYLCYEEDEDGKLTRTNGTRDR